MISITTEERFDEVGPPNVDGDYEYAYRGFNYEIAVGERVFRVRTYDDEPGRATVIDPTDARARLEARELVEFIISSLGCSGVRFYDERVGTYRPVAIATLAFTSGR